MNSPSNFNLDRQPPDGPLFDESDGALPADLAGISSLLDALGASERAAAPASLGGRVTVASAGMLNAGAAAGAARSLADDRQALEAHGPADLEVSTFEASRPHLVEAAARPGLRLADAGRAMPVVRAVVTGRGGTWRLPVMRMAAAVLLGGAVLSAWWVMKPGSLPGLGNVEAIAENTTGSAEAEAVLALDALDEALRFDELDALMAEADGLESSMRGGLIDESELLEQGAM